MTEFLEYELLSPETADPVIMRITGQRERGFRDFTASNGVRVVSHWWPAYGSIPAFDDKPPHLPAPRARILCVWGKHGPKDDSRALEIPLADWPAVKQAIRELNEYMKEKDMISDRYEFDMKEWEYNTEPEPFETTGPAKLIVRRKKSKVEDRENIPVKVEWRLVSTVYHNELAGPPGQGKLYRIVQFRVTGLISGELVSFRKRFGLEYVVMYHTSPTTLTLVTGFPPTLYIGKEAFGKWSTPVLLPESVYKELDNVTKALEERASQ